MDDRSIELILKNDTSGPVAPEEFSLVRGSWAQGHGPERRKSLQPGEEVTWKCHTDAIGVGIAGFMHLSSPKGPVELTWNLPWAEDFHGEVRIPKGLKKNVTIQAKEDPLHPVMTVTLS